MGGAGKAARRALESSDQAARDGLITLLRLNFRALHAECTGVDLAIERRELATERLLTIEITTTADRFDADVSAAFGHLGEALTEAGATIVDAGICGHPKKRTLPGKIRVMAGIPFEGEVDPEPGMKVVELAGGSALVGILHGSYDQLPEAWLEMRESLAEGERPREKAAPYDRFLRGMANVVSPDELITELVLPLA